MNRPFALTLSQATSFLSVMHRLARTARRNTRRRVDRTSPFEMLEPRLVLANVSLNLQNFIPASGDSVSGTVYASMYGQVGSTMSSLTWDNTTGAVTETPIQNILNSQTVSVSASGTQGQNVITVADSTGIQVGMGAFGGISGGQALGTNAKVTAINGLQISLSVPNIVSFNSNSTTPVGGPVVFSPFLPDQALVQPLTIQLPGDVELTSIRMVFTVGAHAYLAINSDATVAPPDTVTLADVPYDFVEFTLDVASNLPSKMNINTSTVDQFGLPIQVTAIPPDPNVPSGVGVYVDRDDVFSDYNTYIAQDTNAQAVFGDLATVEAPERILSPDDRIQLAGAPAAMKTYFDDQITSFFDQYETQTLTMFNVAGADNTGIGGNTNLHNLQGGTVTLPSGQRVLQLTDITPGGIGAGDVYTVYEPFFSTNGYAGYPAPPAWITNPTESPGQMVFATDGVFADNVGQYPNANQSDQSTLLGAIENLIVTAFNRGIALNSYQDWVYNRTVSLQVPATGAAGSTSLTLSTPIVTIVPGMGVTGTGIAPGALVTSVNGTAVVLSIPNSGAVSGQMVFSYAGIPIPFYNPNNSTNPDKIWNWYSSFLHQNSISIDGLAYGFGYDDQGGFSSFFVSGIPGQTTPQSVNIVLGTPAPLAVPTGTTNVTGRFQGGQFQLIDTDHGNQVIGSVPANNPIRILGNAGADTLTIDFSGVPANATGSITFDGAGGANTIQITRGSFAGSLYNYTGPHSGSVQLGSATRSFTIGYSNLTPLINSATSPNATFVLPSGIVGKVQSAGSGMSQLESVNGTFESTTFTNPTGVLTLNVGANGSLRLDQLPANLPVATLNATGNNVVFLTQPASAARNFVAPAGSTGQTLIVDLTRSTNPLHTTAAGNSGTFTFGNQGTVTYTRFGSVVPIERFFRAYNPNNGQHFYTASEGEFDILTTTVGLSDESTGQDGFAVVTSQVTGSVPIYRAYNPNGGQHYYTLSQFELNSLVTAGWNAEGIAGYLFTTPQPGATEIMHLYNDITGEHIFTESTSYRDALIAQSPGIWLIQTSLGFGYAVTAAELPAGSTAPFTTAQSSGSNLIVVSEPTSPANTTPAALSLAIAPAASQSLFAADLPATSGDATSAEGSTAPSPSSSATDDYWSALASDLAGNSVEHCCWAE